MKTFCVTFLLFLSTADIWAGGNTPSLWRWRNDDGDVYNATWKDSTRTPIVYQNEGNIRLRMKVTDDGGLPRLKYFSEPYCIDQGTTITCDDTGRFYLSPSKYIVDNGFYPGGMVFPTVGDSCSGTITVDSSFEYTLPTGNFFDIEIEYCLRPGRNIPEGAVYYIGTGRESEPSPSVIRFPPIYWEDMRVGNLAGQACQIDFIDEHHGWLLSDDFQKTTDGGRTWVRINERVRSFYFIDKDTGWIIMSGAGVEKDIYKTTDGGVSWRLQFLYQSVNSGTFYFRNSRCGWVTRGDNVLITTSDGGSTWSNLPSPAGFMYASYFLNEQTGFVVGSGGIWKTMNGGTTWTMKQSGHVVYSIQFIDQNTGWAAGAEGMILKTTDGGEHWISQATPGVTIYHAIKFVDHNTGWVVGSEGMILATRDGGAHWMQQVSGTRYPLNSISAVNNHVWIGGEGGTLLTSTTGGWTAADDKIASPLPQAFTLYPNYPNPFNPSTTIRYALPRASHVTIRIYDILGRELSTLIDEWKPAGIHEAVWNASRFSSGVYLFRLTAGEFLQARMMALVK